MRCSTGTNRTQAKFVRVTVKNSPGWLEISVDDEGAGFNPAEVPNPTETENILKSSGRGIFFMRNFYGRRGVAHSPGRRHDGQDEQEVLIADLI